MCQVSEIIDRNIYTKVNIKEEIKKRYADGLEKQSNGNTLSNKINIKAYSIMKQFDEENLNYQSIYKELVDIYTYFYTVY